MIEDVLYYTLPCIAELVFPEPAKWKKSWETVYRSLMPHRNSIVRGEERVRACLRTAGYATTARQSRFLDRSGHQRDLPGVQGLRGHAARATHCSARRLREVLAVHPEDQTVGPTTGLSPPRKIRGKISSGSSSPSNHVANYLTIIDLSRSRRSSGRTTRTSRCRRHPER